MHYPRVKDIVRIGMAGGIPAIKAYFDNPTMDIDPSTWCGRIKKSIDEGREFSVLAEIELISEKFNKYENVSKESKRTRIDSTDGNGHQNNKTKIN